MSVTEQGVSTSEATTRGVRVEVDSRYVPERSRPDEGKWFFAYRVRISNSGDARVKLVEESYGEGRLKLLEEGVDKEVADAIEFAIASPEPDPALLESTTYDGPFAA